MNIFKIFKCPHLQLSPKPPPPRSASGEGICKTLVLLVYKNETEKNELVARPDVLVTLVALNVVEELSEPRGSDGGVDVTRILEPLSDFLDTLLGPLGGEIWNWHSSVSTLFQQIF